MLPTDSTERKATPMFSGLKVYFPDALAAVSQVSFAGNEKHNPGEPLHWAREKSSDDIEAAERHLTDRAKGVEFDTELEQYSPVRIRTLACAAWRVLAALQKEIEAAEEVEK